MLCVDRHTKNLQFQYTYKHVVMKGGFCTGICQRQGCHFLSGWLLVRLQRDTIDRAEVVREECGPSQENSRILVYMKTSHLSNFQLPTKKFTLT